MNLLQQFVWFLLSQKSKPSLLTVKNYKADIDQFINWLEKEHDSPFDPSNITLQTIDTYKKIRNLSPSSLERHTSSLHKFFNFLELEKIISQSPFRKMTVSAESQALEDPWKLRNFKSFLYEYKKSNLTIKNYINDMKSFFIWLKEAALVKYAWNLEDKNLLNKINFSLVEEYKQRLIAAKFSPLTINRKLSSLRNYISWAKSQGLISENSEYSETQIVGSSESPSFPSIPNESSKLPPVRLLQKTIGGINFLFDNLFILPLAKTLESTQYIFWKAGGKKVFKKNKISILPALGGQTQNNNISNIQKEFYAPLDISTHYLPVYKKVWHYIRYVRPNWYKKYHQYPFTHYFHFAILMTLSCAVGFGIYDGLFANAQKGSTLAATSIAVPRILSFQGKLTDSSEAVITQETTILFSLYDLENASAGAFLWQETDSVKPDSNGIFSVLLGKKTPIPDIVFSQNSKLFLGITPENSQELLPRQEIATVPLAGNSQRLQGLESITNTTKTSNVVLALDSSGNLSIADSKPHTFQATGSQFIISGNILSLTTIPGSNSNVEIVPDGLGKIDLSKPIQNSTNNNNLTSALGSVEFDDTVAILATTSAQSALYINQNSTGQLISANTNGIAKFAVENDGTGVFTGDLGVNGGDLTTTATAFNLLNSTVATLNIGGAATNLVLGAATGTITIKNASAAIQGNITFGDSETDTINFTGRVAENSDLLPIGTTGTNDLGASSLSWDNAYIENIYSASTGISGHWQRNAQTLSPTNISDDILTGATSTSSALIKLSGTGGNNSWINAGNLGIGTTAPAAPLEVRGSGTGGLIAKFTDNNTTGCSIAGDGTISCSSDMTLKKNFENISYGLDTIIALKPIAFNWKFENDDAIKNLGFIAQEVEQIIPKLITQDSNGYKQLNTIGLIPILTKALQEQQIQIASFAKTLTESIKTKLINAQEIITNTLIVTSDSLIISGQSLKDYIARVINELEIKKQETGIISPVVNTNQLSANIISPLGESLIVRLATPSAKIQNSEFIIQNSSGSAVVKIDDQGNASFSGQLTSNNLTTNHVSGQELAVSGNASISGTLRAGNIFADSISGLDEKISTIYNTNFADLASYSAQLSNIPDLSAERAQFNQGLMVFGPTSLSDLSIAGRLAIGGTMFVTQNSIETLGADLSLQSLRQGNLSIMGGLIYIDTEGNIKIQGDLSVTGKLVVNNASGSGVLSVSQTGDVIASGSGTFSKLNFNLIQPVLAVSATEVIASSSAGVANIAPYQSELTIKNALATDKSVIYITPVGTPSAEVPFLMRQLVNEFTVGVQSPTNHSIDFNWLIIN